MADPYPVCGECKQRHMQFRACRREDLDALQRKNTPERANKATPAAQARCVGEREAAPGVKRPTVTKLPVRVTKLGRKPKGANAMSVADRMREYRKRLAEGKA